MCAMLSSFTLTAGGDKILKLAPKGFILLLYHTSYYVITAVVVPQSSAPLQQVRVLLVPFVFCLISGSLHFLSSHFSYLVVLILLVGVCLCALVPGTLAYDIPILINSQMFFYYLSVSQSDHRIWTNLSHNITGHLDEILIYKLSRM